MSEKFFNMRRWLVRILLILITYHLSLTTSIAQRPQYGKMSPLLRQLSRQVNQRDRFLIHRALGDIKALGCAAWLVQEPVPLIHAPQRVCMFAKVTDTQALTDYDCRLLAQVGGVCIVDAPISELGALSLDSRVLRMEARQGNSIQTNQMASLLNALPVYAGENLPQAFTGKGVVVGMMDVGFDLTQPNFYSADTTQYRIKKFWDMVTQDTVGSRMYVGRDYQGREELLRVGHSRDGLDLTHGTHTTGIAAGSGYHSSYRGMAPEADLCLVSNAVSDDIVYIDSADYYKYTFATDALGFKFLFDYAKSVGKPCVASFSEGTTQDFWGYDQLYYEMLDSLVGPGRILVSAAGNNAHLKSWFRKPESRESMGAFLSSDRSDMMLTFKSAQDFMLRFILYSGDRDTLLIRTSDVLLQEDSVLASVLRFDDYNMAVITEAYPSCYDTHEMCYDVTVITTYNIGEKRHLSVEVVGSDADVEFFRVNGSLYTSSQNPALDAGEGIYSINSPSSAPCVICVGATSYRDSIQNINGEWQKYWLGHGGVRAPFSSIGPTFDGRIKPDVMAPGNNIISSYSSFYMAEHPDATDLEWDVAHFDFQGRTYAWTSNSGTSSSCPAVAGAIALWLQAKPDLTPEEVKDVLSHTCRHYDESLIWPNNEYGYGEIDVYRGLLYILGIDRIEAVSKHHTSACIRYADNQLRVSFEEPLSSSVRLRLYNMSGRLAHTAVLKAGQTSYSLPIYSLPSGIYALQLDGPSAVKGSTLIRM